MNDEIDPTLCSVHYSGIDEAVAVVCRLGRGCHLAKTDLKSAYHIILVHPDDRPLLGIKWEESVFLDAALPFRLSSPPKYSPLSWTHYYGYWPNGELLRLFPTWTTF